MLSSNVDSWIREVSGPLLARPMTGRSDVRASDAPGPIDVTGKGVVPSNSLRTRVSRLWGPDVVAGRRARVIRISANLVGAGGAALFAQASLQVYLRTHRLIGVAFCAEQAWVAVAYLVRRPARVVTRRTGDWLLAFGGTFGGVLFRPVGVHPSWGVGAGLGLQLLGLGIFVCSFFALGRSFGFCPRCPGGGRGWSRRRGPPPHLRLLLPLAARVSAAEPLSAQRARLAVRDGLQRRKGARRRTSAHVERALRRLSPAGPMEDVALRLVVRGARVT